MNRDVPGQDSGHSYAGIGVILIRNGPEDGQE